MLDIDIAIRNYRCFGDTPSRFRITDGFTAFVGVNNSGKSSLLRLLYETRGLFGNLASVDSIVTKSLLRGGDGSSLGGFWTPAVLPGERFFRADTDRSFEISLTVRDGPHGRFAHDGEQVIVTFTTDRGMRTESILKTESGAVLGGPNQSLDEMLPTSVAFISAMQELTNTLYVGPFRNAIGSAQSNYYDIQTGSAFIQTFNTFKAGDVPDQNEAVFQLLQEIRRIFGFDTLDLNAGPSGQSLQMTLDGRSYRLSEQGAGLTHFIVVLVNVLVRRPTFLLIDEPELNLHSALQLDFLSTLARYTTRGVMFATHSLGLARTGADHIYALVRPNGGWSQVSKYEESRDLVTLLGQLSFDQRPDLGFDRVLLVEGKSDLRAVSRLLRLYDKEHQVLLLPLHGGELIRGDVEQELIDMKRLGGNPKYLIDSERERVGAALGADRQAFVELCKRLGITGHVLARRALENYFTDDAVKRIFRDNLHALGPYEKRGWPKRENWRIADVMHRDDIDGTDLGEFLSTV